MGSQNILIVAIVAGVLIAGLAIIILICLCRRNSRCLCACWCIAQLKDRSNYEKISESDTKSFGQDTCLICLEQMKTDDDVYGARCLHKFHIECLELWLEEYNRCPLCNGTIVIIPHTGMPLSRV